MASPAIIACANCGKKNRVAVAQRGIPRCAVCGTTLPEHPPPGPLRDGEAIDRLVGAVPERQLRQWLDPRLAPAETAPSG